MHLLKVACTALFSILELFLLAKWMGNRQMSQLTMFEYIIGITIGSIAAEMAVSGGGELFWPAAVSMAVYAAVAFFLSLITDKSIVCRRLITGRARILLYKGELYRRNFKRSHLDLSEFQMLCRNAGYFDLSQLACAVMESNGTISFLPKSGNRPATPQDLSLPVEEDGPLFVVIMDGKLLPQNLKACGVEAEWIKKQLKQQGVSTVEEALLATVNHKKELSVYRNVKSRKTGKDMFE